MFGGLSRAETRTVLTNPRYLPSIGEQVAQYNKKVFCGTHARDGDLFITACPDKIRLYDTRQERFKLIQEIEVYLDDYNYLEMNTFTVWLYSKTSNIYNQLYSARDARLQT